MSIERNVSAWRRCWIEFRLLLGTLLLEWACYMMPISHPDGLKFRQNARLLLPDKQ